MVPAASNTTMPLKLSLTTWASVAAGGRRRSARHPAPIADVNDSGILILTSPSAAIMRGGW
jgi:hypothetical protein